MSAKANSSVPPAAADPAKAGGDKDDESTNVTGATGPVEGTATAASGRGRKRGAASQADSGGGRSGSTHGNTKRGRLAK